MKIHILTLDWCVKGQGQHEVIGAYPNKEQACMELTDRVKTDFENIDWLNRCAYSEASDADGNEVASETVRQGTVPLSHFLIQETPYDQSNYYEEYSIKETELNIPAE